MCKSIADGGTRCTGQHLKLTSEQRRERTERRRARDRAWKAANKSAEQEVSTSLPDVRCTVPRPDDIPEGYIHRSTLRKRPGGGGIEMQLDREGLKRRTEHQDGELSVWWYPAAEVARLEASAAAAVAEQEVSTSLPDPLHPSQRVWMDEQSEKYRRQLEWDRKQGFTITAPPEGYVMKDELWARGWDGSHTKRYDHLSQQHIVCKQMGFSEPCYPRDVMERAETTDVELMTHLAKRISTWETRKIAKDARKQAGIERTKAKNAARTSQRQADDEMAKAAGHPYGKDAIIRKLATPAARDKSATGEPVFVRHDDTWKLLQPSGMAWAAQIDGERFEVKTLNGRNRRVRVTDVQDVGAHNGELMSLCAISDTPGPAEAQRIAEAEARKRAEEAARRAAEAAARAQARAAAEAAREQARKDAAAALDDRTVGDQISYAGADNINAVVNGSDPRWSKTDGGTWVVIARAKDVEKLDSGLVSVDVSRRDFSSSTQELAVTGRATVDGTEVLVLSKPRSRSSEGCYSCGGPGPLDEYGYCGC